jgi:hypothetical protein
MGISSFKGNMPLKAEPVKRARKIPAWGVSEKFLTKKTE